VRIFRTDNSEVICLMHIIGLPRQKLVVRLRNLDNRVSAYRFHQVRYRLLNVFFVHAANVQRIEANVY
jgi:hypothetical protein